LEEVPGAYKFSEERIRKDEAQRDLSKYGNENYVDVVLKSYPKYESRYILR